MPYNDRSLKQLEEYELTIGCLQCLIDSHIGCYFVFGGDLNTSKDVGCEAALRLKFFSQSNQLCWVDRDLRDVNYTFHCEFSKHYSMLDYFLCSPAVLVDSEVKSRILVDGSNISDHYAIAVDVIIPADGCLRDLRVTKSAKFCWDRADMSQYRSACDSFLGGIDIPIDALLCKSHNCVSHVPRLQKYYNDIVECMQISANIVVPTVTVGVEKPWWSPELTDLKLQCIEITELWRNCGCPHMGTLNQSRIQAKLRYKSAIKDAVYAYENEFNEDLFDQLSKKDMHGFWKAWKKKFC